MTLKKVIGIGDVAIGHTDIDGNPVTGTVQNGSDKTTVGGVGVARDGGIVFFPSHAHAHSGGGGLTNYRTHSIPITASSKHTSNGVKIALEGDLVPVADEAGGNATLVASQSKTKAA